MIDYDLLEIENTATKLRTLFIDKKTKQLGRSYRPSRKIDTKENWNKAAIKCEALDARPEDFINSVFASEVGKKHGGPYVNHLHGIMCEKAYEKYELAGGHLIEENKLLSELKSATNQCFSALKYQGITAEEYLLKDTVPISSWIRLYFCQGSKRIWRKYVSSTKKEMIVNSGIEKLLRKFKFKIEKIYEFDKYG